MSKKFTVRNSGTADCYVRVRFSKEEIKTIRAYFGKADRIKFASSELYSQGWGWWHIYGDDIRIDAALIGLKHCLNALARKQRPVLEDAPVVLASTYVVKPRLIKGHVRPVAVSRKVQAELNKDAELTRAIQELLSIPTLEQKLSNLAQRFG